jgi:hypothetical protein
MSKKTFLIGCSFTDPVWQEVIPWSVRYGQNHPSYISAKAGMGIKGICTEALYWLETIESDVDNLVIVLPNLWRYDIEVDQETYLCNAMVDLLVCDAQGWRNEKKAQRKWITSGGLHYDKTTEMASAFNFLYRHQGFLVILKEHIRALEALINHCKCHKINYVISAIQDPLDQLTGLDYIKDQIVAQLSKVQYAEWLKFEGNFIDKFLGHQEHPNNHEHELLCSYIEQSLTTRTSNG